MIEAKTISEAAISVIISSYNYGHYIGQALDSVLDQSYSNWECLVIDDGSTDNTREIVEEYVKRDSRFHYLYQPNQGQSIGLNNGVRATHGPYIQILDADDVLPPEKFQRQALFLDTHPEFGVVYGGYTYFRDADSHSLSKSAKVMLERVEPLAYGSDRELLTTLIHRNFLAINAPLLRRSVFERVGGFDEDRDAIADWSFWIGCARKEVGFHCLPDEATYPLVRFHPDSRSANRTKFHTRVIKLRRKIQATFEDKEILHLNRISWAELEGFCGIREIIQGETLVGLQRLMKAAWNSPGIKWKARWIYCIAIWPISARHEYEKVATASIGQSLKLFLRSDSRGD